MVVVDGQRFVHRESAGIAEGRFADEGAPHREQTDANAGLLSASVEVR